MFEEQVGDIYPNCLVYSLMTLVAEELEDEASEVRSASRHKKFDTRIYHLEELLEDCLDRYIDNPKVC